jgi:arginyl-tRNA synthetase
MKSELHKIFTDSICKVYPDLDPKDLAFTVDVPANSEHGDFATNAAMQLAKMAKRNPREVANILIEFIQHPDIDRVEVAGPGFINVFMKTETLQRWLAGLLKSEEPLKSNIGDGKRVMVEFVSANPTGPLHIGHGRGAALGDSLARILEATGHKVHREYYVNDAGNQMQNLAGSIFSRYTELFSNAEQYPFPKDGYNGDYIYDIAKSIEKTHGKKLLEMSVEEALEICKKTGISTILNDINSTLKRFNVHMDEYFHESTLYDKGDLKKTLATLEKSGATYKKDGAVWLSTERLGDEKDRVLQKSDGTYTYLAPDIAYHKNKFERKFDLLIDIWGADHHGYVKRMECALELLGYDPKRFDVILAQMVNLLEEGMKKTMSTRAGDFIPLDWLVGQVGADAARFFYSMRSSDSQFDFDLDLAKKETSDNPVYYVQYAHARVCNLFVNAHSRGIKYKIGGNLDKLGLPAARELV